MANNRMFLVHRPTGLNVGLGKRMNSAWYTGRDTGDIDRLHDAVDAALPIQLKWLRDDYVLAVEEGDGAPGCTDRWRVIVGEARILITDPRLPMPRPFWEWTGTPDPWDGRLIGDPIQSVPLNHQGRCYLGYHLEGDLCVPDDPQPLLVTVPLP